MQDTGRRRLGVVGKRDKTPRVGRGARGLANVQLPRCRRPTAGGAPPALLELDG